ncbi:radical SAM domain protein [Desulfosarcina variabilis str. Montpellier]|uniref:radical SAM protein n=1 Tax=Desulfosarcina variabilis TaxID=2300 RepID=UPI003AFADF95
MSTPHYSYLFGPVPSRRFGRSLGIDLIPLKTCSLDCVFCQLGRTTCKTLDREEYVPTTDVIKEIETWLKSGVEADYLTLSGSGEPTLHAQFGQVLDFLRPQSIPSVLLTNGTLFHLPEVREAAGLARVVKVSLSAWDQHSFEWVNRPHAQLDFMTIYKGLQEFRNAFDGQLWLEVFLLAGINAMAKDTEKIARLTRDLKPDRIHLNTIARPPAEDFAAPVPMAQLEQLAGLFDPPAQIAADFTPRRTSKTIADEASILAMLARRPCTMKQVEAAFGIHLNEVSKILGHLIRNDRIRADIRNDDVYYALTAK